MHLKWPWLLRFFAKMQEEHFENQFLVKKHKSLFPLAGFDPQSTAWQSGVLAIRPPKLR